MNISASSGVKLSDPELSAKDFDAIAALALREFGLSLPATKRQLVQSRIARRIRALRLPDFTAYRDFLEGPEGLKEQTALLSVLTTNVTKFFREIHHFEDLMTDQMPRLIERAQRGDRVRLWSAGCSSGQEAYSIAMVALKCDPDIGKRDFKILATDIDPNILAKAQAAIYDDIEIEAVPGQFYRSHDILRNAKIGAGSFSPSPEVQNLVKFAKLNLISPLPFSGEFHVIFCRNVAIYFDAPTQNRVWGNLAHLIGSGGKFYIGHSERIKNPAEFRMIPTGITTYQKQ